MCQYRRRRRLRQGSEVSQLICDVHVVAVFHLASLFRVTCRSRVACCSGCMLAYVKFRMLYVVYMLDVGCWMLDAATCNLHHACNMNSAFDRALTYKTCHATSCMLHVGCWMLHACWMLDVGCCMLHVACCMLHACCMYIACVLHAWCMIACMIRA